MSKHTPGPWTIVPIEEVIPKLFEVHSPQSVIAYNLTDGNARLIAAAPELLEALKEVARREREDDEIDPHRGTGQDLESIERAIARAEGRHE